MDIKRKSAHRMFPYQSEVGFLGFLLWPKANAQQKTYVVPDVAVPVVNKAVQLPDAPNRQNGIVDYLDAIKCHATKYRKRKNCPGCCQDCCGCKSRHLTQR